ncbi:MAG: aminotransferase class III-fold pyridoxal phosphate-dependent enzyme [Myxococcaceae bacterium]|nr:aminotransferase class III-fold pyridoxal phosphate-dependent enzyme [Myxococcaceae bacterium]
MGPETTLNPTLKRLLSMCGMDRKWARASGCELWDESGRRFLDFYAQYGAVALGHNAPRLVRALREALDEREPAMVQPYRAPHAEALATALCGAAPPGLDRCIFTTSGSESVEAAIKLVRARSGRRLIVSAEGSYHGKTMGALAATGQRHHAEGFGDAPPGFLHVPFGDVAALEQVFAAHGPDVAAVLLEPVQGERGVFPAPAGYLAEARALCTRHGAALVLDEVQTGLCRTGPFFACAAEGVAPDVLLVAKGLGGGLMPLGAMLCTEPWWDEHFALSHSSTFANNNLACRVGLEVLAMLGDLVPSVEVRGERLQAGLEGLAARFPNTVAAVRCRGLLGAIELKPPSEEVGLFFNYLHEQSVYAYAVASAIAAESGVLVLPALGKGNVLRVAPPLTVCGSELDEGLEGIAAVLERLERGELSLLPRTLGAFEPRRDVVATEPVRLPAAEPIREGRVWAFLSHYTRAEDVRVTEPALASCTAAELERFTDFAAALPFGVTVRAAPLTSKAGATARGFVLSAGMTPQRMFEVGRRRVEAEVQRAVDLAASLGAQVVGLGGFTTPYSRRGAAVLGRGAAVTTGSALTAGMAVAAVQRVVERRGFAFGELEVAVVGARGSVGALCTQLVARLKPRRLVLIGNPVSGTKALKQLAARVDLRDVEVTTGLERVARARVVLSATGAMRPVLDQAPIASGTIVCDVARPPDASPRLRARRDVTVIDGGLVALPDPNVRFGPGSLQGLPAGVALACLSETILLALAGEPRDRGIGDDVDVSEVDEVMALAERHGFRLAEPATDALDDAPLLEVAR